MVWAWSRAQVLSGQDGAMLSPPRRLIPESLFRGQPQPLGEELVMLDEGVEARVWRDGALTGSRWWPELPELMEWNEFRRGAGLPPAPTLPEPLAPSLAERPWQHLGAQGLEEQFGHYRRHLGLAAAGVACAVLAAFLVGEFALRWSIWQVDEQISEHEQALGKIIAARDRAFSGLRDVDAELALRPPAGQVELMSIVDGLMRGSWQLQEWKLIDASNLQVTAQMVNPDPRAIVTGWERSGRFTEVTAELARQPNTVVVKARILAAKRAKGAR